MAEHYPADHEVFALVRIDDPNCAPKDKKLVQMVSDKIGFDFIATAEDDKTLVVMFDLEQRIGREIQWVTDELSFDELCQRRKFLANKVWRICTVNLKIRPIYRFWRALNIPPMEMRIGFRYDEKERAENVSIEFNGVHWRVPSFPLITDRVTHYPIYKWAMSTGIEFPDDSNCVHCFWKPNQQLRKNWDDNPQKMAWAASKETKKRRWKSDITMDEIKRIGLQTDFYFGTGSGCQAGFCTD